MFELKLRHKVFCSQDNASVFSTHDMAFVKCFIPDYEQCKHTFEQSYIPVRTYHENPSMTQAHDKYFSTIRFLYDPLTSSA